MLGSASGSIDRRAARRNNVIDQQFRAPTKPIPAATRNFHLDNATSGATFRRTVQPSPGQDKPPVSSRCRLRALRRACWGSQSTSGRSQRWSSRFSLQFRRVEHPGGSCMWCPATRRRTCTLWDGWAAEPDPRRHRFAASGWQRVRDARWHCVRRCATAGMRTPWPKWFVIFLGG